MAEQRMYATADRARWFSVPTDVTPAAGDLEVRDLLGRSRRWSAEALAPFEVDAAQAKDLSRRELVGWLGRAESGIASLRAAMDAQDPGKGEALAGLQSVVGTIAVRLRAPGDPARAAPAVVDLKDRLEAFVKGALEDPEKSEKLREVAADLQRAAERLKER